MENIFMVKNTQLAVAIDKLEVIKAIDMIVESHATGVNISAKGPDGDAVSVGCYAAEVMNKEIIEIPVSKTFKAALKKFSVDGWANLQLFDGIAGINDGSKIIKSKYQQADKISDTIDSSTNDGRSYDGQTTISYEELKNVYDKLKKFTSTDATKPVLNTIYFNGAEAAALDGYKLGTVQMTANFEGGLILPTIYIERVLKLYKGTKEDLLISWCANSDTYVRGDVKGLPVGYKCSREVAEFIDYKKLFTKAYDLHYFDINKKALLEAVDYAHSAAAGQKNSLMMIEANAANSLTIKAANKENTLSDTVTAFNHMLDLGYKIGVNSKYMLDVLQTMFKGSDNIEMAVTTNVDPIIFKDNDCKCLVLPVRVTQV